eukprot:7386079-Prymnesium_polylepis.2
MAARDSMNKRFPAEDAARPASRLMRRSGQRAVGPGRRRCGPRSRRPYGRRVAASGRRRSRRGRNQENGLNAHSLSSPEGTRACATARARVTVSQGGGGRVY